MTSDRRGDGGGPFTGHFSLRLPGHQGPASTSLIPEFQAFVPLWLITVLLPTATSCQSPSRQPRSGFCLAVTDTLVCVEPFSLELKVNDKLGALRRYGVTSLILLIPSGQCTPIPCGFVSFIFTCRIETWVEVIVVTSGMIWVPYDQSEPVISVVTSCDWVGGWAWWWWVIITVGSLCPSLLSRDRWHSLTEMSLLKPTSLTYQPPISSSTANLIQHSLPVF